MSDHDAELCARLADLALIRDLLVEVERRPLIEYWAYSAWGALVLAGSLVQ